MHGPYNIKIRKTLSENDGSSEITFVITAQTKEHNTMAVNIKMFDKGLVDLKILA
jgi:hypothetical protein